MKRSFWLAALALILLPPNLRAQTPALKVATVDLTKLFDGYYKTKEADSKLLERVQDADKVLKGMFDDYQKANDDYKKLVESANNQALSPEERDKQKKSAEGRLVEIRDLEKQVQTYKISMNSQINDQKSRMRDRILGEIRDAINSKARSASVNLIVDASAEGSKFAPIFLYVNGLPDWTDDILKQLNANAPPGALSSATNSIAKPLLPDLK